MSIQQAVAASGLTDAEFAKKAGIDPATAWRYRKGKMYPKPSEAPRLAAVLGCAPADLVHPALAALLVPANDEAKK